MNGQPGMSPARANTQSNGRESDISRAYREQIDNLQDYAERLEASRPQPPVNRHDFSQINVRQELDRMRREGASTNEIIAARERMEAENAARRTAERELRRDIRRQYSTPEQEERAMARELARRERDYNRQLNQYNSQNRTIDNTLRTIDGQITQAEVNRVRAEQAAERQESADQRRAEQDAERARQQALREQIEADRQAERERQAAERAARTEAADARRAAQEADQERRQPMTDYTQTLRTREAFNDAISRGDYNYAQRLIPGADIDAARREYDTFMSGIDGLSVTRRNQEVRDFRRTQPPMRDDEE
jgi:phage-related minor tail protein